MRYILIILCLVLYSCGGGGSSSPPIEVDEMPKEVFDYERARELILGTSYVSPDYPEAVTASIEAAYQSIPMRGIDVLTITTDGEISNPLIFWPVYPNNRLAIYHNGHGQFFDGVDSVDAVSRLLDQGYTVIALEMPRGDHYRFESNTHPLRVFIHPVIVALNYMIGYTDWDRVVMIGLSGGGWTTHLTAAIDHRITHSYPVAGSIPIDLRPVMGDFEQTDPALYKEFGYRDLYVMAADFGRRQVQILNSEDSCCFQGNIYAHMYRDAVKSRARNLPGYWDVLVVTETGHKINEEAWNIIFSDINKK